MRVSFAAARMVLALSLSSKMAKIGDLGRLITWRMARTERKSIDSYSNSGAPGARLGTGGTELYARWRELQDPRGRSMTTLDEMYDEQHFKPDELAKLWGVGVNTIRRLFRDVTGVLVIDSQKKCTNVAIARCGFLSPSQNGSTKSTYLREGGTRPSERITPTDVFLCRSDQLVAASGGSEVGSV
jgi:hypothetical protein